MVANINTRFMEASFGYQIEDNTIIRLDSNFTHNHIVKPALFVLRNAKYSVANDEYMRAHEHFRHGNYEDCIVNCLKAFETTMKVIATERRWDFDPHGNASRLIGVMFDNNLVPTYLQTQFTALRSCLESGVPTVRNKAAGHGRGERPPPPAYLAGFVLQQTASNIVLLANASDSMADPE
jgi:hypothetical protein